MYVPQAQGGSFGRIVGLGLTVILAVPPSARFGLGSWEVGRTGRESGQSGGASKIKINPTIQPDGPRCIIRPNL